jgi:hypothetical protein
MTQASGSGWGPIAVHHLDYVSCVLTVISTILVGRKHWMGLVIASFNSMIVCAISLHTVQYGLIAANLFCIITYALSVRSWRRARKPTLVSAAAPAPRVAPERPQPRTRANAPSRKLHTGLFLAYSSRSFSQIAGQVASSNVQAAGGLMNSSSVAGATTAN